MELISHVVHPGILVRLTHRYLSGLAQVGQALPTKSPEIRLKQAYFGAIVILEKMYRFEGGPLERAADAALPVTVNGHLAMI